MVTITINSPKDIESKRVSNEINQAVKEGKKSKEIHLICDFFSTDEVYKLVGHQFKVLRSKAAFAHDTTRH